MTPKVMEGNGGDFRGRWMRWVYPQWRGQLRYVVLLFASLACSTARATPPVVRWNELALDAIRFANTPPPIASRNLAVLHLAIFDAANGLGGPCVAYRLHQNTPSAASGDAAIAAAANRVLRLSWPQFAYTFDAELSAQLVALPSGKNRDAGVAWGREVADSLLRERDFDGANFGVDYRASVGPGRWQPTPGLYGSALLPQWPGVQPFALARGDQFRPAHPPLLSSAEWAMECNEVKRLGAGDSAVRTSEQTEIAWFWADAQGTQTPPGHWNDVAIQLAEAKQLSLLETSRLFALLNLALADAAIACWDAKYAYDWWRPVTAIRAADTDGNPATAADPGWTPLISTPPFPEHVSGHSTFSAAAATVLAAFNGSDRFSFTLRSDGLFGVTRSFNRFSDAAVEAGLSRIYGGIHFRSANEGGQALGRAIGEFVAANYLLPRADLRLSIQIDGGSVTVRWPAGARIETATALGGATWVPVLGFGEGSLGKDEVSARFFRIR
jgi:hypothetical protein